MRRDGNLFGLRTPHFGFISTGLLFLVFGNQQKASCLLPRGDSLREVDVEAGVPRMAAVVATADIDGAECFGVCACCVRWCVCVCGCAVCVCMRVVCVCVPNVRCFTQHTTNSI